MSTELPQLPASLAANPAGLVLALNDRLRRISIGLGGAPGAAGTAGTAGAAGAPGAAGGTQQIFYGTHAARLSTPVPGDASLYVETDRGNVIYQVQVTIWQYIAGRCPVAQAGIAAIAAGLGAADAGLLLEITDYAHVIQWTGAAWQRGEGDSEHSDSFHEFGAAPTDNGWHACDGTTQAFLQYDNPTVLGSRLLPSLAAAGAYALGGASYAAAVTAAHAPHFAFGVTTGAEATGISVAGAAAAAAATATTGSIDAGTGAATAVLIPPFTGGGGGGGGGGVTDPTHSHSLSAAPISLLGGDPIPNFSVIKWYRQ